MITDSMGVQTVSVVTVQERTEVITRKQFSGKNVYRVSIPKSVVEIQDEAFSGCRNLKEVAFEDGSALRKIGQGAFSGCICLRNIDLPDNLEEIGAGAFQGSNLEGLVVPKSLRILQQNAFQDCVNLKTVWVKRGCAVDVRQLVGSQVEVRCK